jgi:hypothetical protein
MMERQILVAPKNVDSMPLFTESKKVLQEPLSLNARDRILGMVLEACPKSASSRIIASFASAEFLTNCIQYCFGRRHEEQIDSYIHLPTLRLADQRAELLVALFGCKTSEIQPYFIEESFFCSVFQDNHHELHSNSTQQTSFKDSQQPLSSITATAVNRARKAPKILQS